MPLFVIERAFAEQLELTSDDVKLIEEVNADEGVRWLFSFLSADRRRSNRLRQSAPDRPKDARSCSTSRRDPQVAHAVRTSSIGKSAAQETQRKRV